MKQPDGLLQFYDALNKQSVQGFFSRGLDYPVLANNQKILPFQIKRDVTGNAIDVFRLVQQDGTEIDLIADKDNISITEFDTFEQLIYLADTNLSETPIDGYYYLEIQDSVNIWYSDYFHLSAYPLSSITFGAYTNAYTNAYQQESISSTQDSDYLRLMFSNTFDLEDKVYQFGFQDLLILDSRFNPFHIYDNQKEEVKLNESTGKEVPNKVISYDQFKITFTHNKNIARILSKLITLDILVIILPNGEKITSNDFDVDIENLDTDLYSTITITYRINFNDSSGNVNFVAA